MKNRNYFFIPFLLLFTAAALRGQTNRFAMPLVAGALNLENVEIINKIPKSHLDRLPSMVVVFKYSSKPRSLPLNALQSLLDETVFRGTNLSNYLPASTFGIRLADGNNNYFIITPQQDHVLIGNVEKQPATPPPDAVPSFDVVEKRLMQLINQFGINTNELERGENGAIRVQKADATTTRLGGAVRFVSERSAKVFRHLGGHTTWLLNDGVSLRLGIDGQLLQFQLKWSSIEPLRTNQVFQISKVIEEIKNGQVVADVMDTFPIDGIAKIELKDIVIDYYAPPQDTRMPLTLAKPVSRTIFPVASLLVTFKSKSGQTEEGGLFVPIIDMTGIAP
jgi:hypothetical protein